MCSSSFHFQKAYSEWESEFSFTAAQNRKTLGVGSVPKREWGSMTDVMAVLLCKDYSAIYHSALLPLH